MRANFTLNLGLRYDLNGFFRARYYPMGNFCFTCLNPVTGLQGENIYEGSAGFPVATYFRPTTTASRLASILHGRLLPSAKRSSVVVMTFSIPTRLRVSMHRDSPSSTERAGASAEVGTKVSIHNVLLSGGPCVAFPLSDTTTNKTNLLFPSITGPFPAQTRENLLGGTYAFVKPTRDPMVQSYTLEIQQEFPGKLTVSLAYVGTHGTHLAGSGPNAYLLNYVSTQNKLQYQTQLSIIILFRSSILARLPHNWVHSMQIRLAELRLRRWHSQLLCTLILSSHDSYKRHIRWYKYL